MAKTLEKEEESRIAELERIASEGDEIEKMIAEVELAEERKRVARDAAYAIQEEEETETPLVPRIKSKTVLPKSTKQVIENERAGLGKELERDVSEAVKELEPAGLPEKPTPMELLFTKKELALHKASEEAKLQKALSKITAKSADEAFEERERYRKDKLEKYPKATFKQRLVEGFGIGLTPATKANVESARAVGAAMDDFDARMKVDKATSSARSARIGAAIGGVETKAIVDVMTGMSDRANLKYFNEVRAKSGSFFKNFLNVGADATPAEEKAAQERVIWLARQGNETANLQLQALASQYNSFAAARKLTVASERLAAQKRSDKLWSDASAAQQLNATNWGKKAVDEDGIFQRSRLPAHVLESMQDGKGNRTLFGDHVLAGADAIIIGESAATRTQIRENRSEAEEVANQLGNYLGFAPVPFDSQTLSRKTSLTNRKNIDDLREKLVTAKEYTKVMGEPPAFVKNNINFRNSLLKQKAELQEELEGVDRFSEQGADIGFALGRLNRSLVKTDIEIQTSFDRMAATTEEIKEGDKTAADVAKTTLLAKQKAGQERVDEFYELIGRDKREAENQGPKPDGIAKGGGLFELTYFDRDPDTGRPLDVKRVFRPWLGTHTQASKGGPVRIVGPSDRGGVYPNDLKRVSNAYEWDAEEEDFELSPSTAQQGMIDGSRKEWEKDYGEFEEQEPEVGELGREMTGEEGIEQPPAITPPAQPVTVPISANLAVIRKTMSAFTKDPRTNKPWARDAVFKNPIDNRVYYFDGTEWQER